MIGSKERIAALVVVGITAVGAVGASLATAGGGSRTDQIRHQLKSGNHVRNVIFFLGDGMGTQEMTARRHATPRGL